jgi:hypothetical protein
VSLSLLAVALEQLHLVCAQVPLTSSAAQRIIAAPQAEQARVSKHLLVVVLLSLAIAPVQATCNVVSLELAVVLKVLICQLPCRPHHGHA